MCKGKQQMNLWKLTSVVIGLTLSTSLNASIISVDWQTTDDNLITQDTENNLEWLDLTATTNLSYDYVSSQLGVGGVFEGWRYALSTDVIGFLDEFGGDSNYYNGWSTQNNGLFDAVSEYWGDTYCYFDGCAVGSGSSSAIIADESFFTNHMRTYLYDGSIHPSSLTEDRVNVLYSLTADSVADPLIGHALVREISTVPVPAAVWLFGSGLIGLVGFSRRKKA